MQNSAHLRNYLIINCFRCPLCDIKQIMTSVYILSCFIPFLEYRDNEIGPLDLFLSLSARKGIKQDRIYTSVIICVFYLMHAPATVWLKQYMVFYLMYIIVSLPSDDLWYFI